MLAIIDFLVHAFALLGSSVSVEGRGAMSYVYRGIPDEMTVQSLSAFG